MNTTYPMYADVARTAMTQRLREAEAARRRRLVRNGHRSTPGSPQPALGSRRAPCSDQ